MKSNFFSFIIIMCHSHYFSNFINLFFSCLLTVITLYACIISLFLCVFTCEILREKRIRSDTLKKEWNSCRWCQRTLVLCPYEKLKLSSHAGNNIMHAKFMSFYGHTIWAQIQLPSFLAVENIHKHHNLLFYLKIQVFQWSSHVKLSGAC